MSDLISREALRKAIDNAYKEYDGYDPNDLMRFAERVDTELDNAPTVERQYFPPCEDCHKKMDDIRRAYDKAMARPKGEWIDYDNTFYKCPDCGYLLEKCCPRCQNMVILPTGGR